MKTNEKVILAIVIIAIIGGAYYMGAFDQWLAVTPYEPVEGEWLGGTFDLTVAGRNTLDSSVSLVDADFTANWYAYRNGVWVFLGSGVVAGTEIESIAEDNGYIWLLVEELSSKYFYADTSMTLSKNTYITDYKWVDADGDTDKEFLYKVNLWNIPEPASGYPSRTFYPYFLAVSGGATDANALQWETQPANVTGISTTTTQTKYIGWETKLNAEKKAVGIYKIEIVVGSTSTTLWQIDKVNIPGIGYLDGSLFTEDVRTSDTKYQYIIGTDFNDIVYWKVPSGTNNKQDCTVAVKCTFAGSEDIAFTLYVYQWLFDRTSEVDSDTVYLQAA